MGQERSQTLAFHRPCSKQRVDSRVEEQHEERDKSENVQIMTWKERRRRNSRFRKRRQTFLKSAQKLHEDCEVDVYVAVRKGDRFFSYSSTPEERWHMEEAKRVCSRPRDMGFV